ncbi:MAG: phage tail assembly protein [Xanthomonadales bacterium]|jgi:hypothetical protein|nr:phage tail assembly protein [Xanthomonadales bacterium]
MTEQVEEAAPQAIQNELVITLLRPVKLADLEFLEVRLTEPTMGQMRQASKAGGPLDQLAMLIAQNASVPPAVVDRMLKRDIDRAGDFFAQFESPTR